MRTVKFELSEEQFARLAEAAENRHETPNELLKAQLIGLLVDPIDPFDPRGKRWRERDEEFLRRIA